MRNILFLISLLIFIVLISGCVGKPEGIEKRLEEKITQKIFEGGPGFIQADASLKGPGGCEGFECQYTCLEDDASCLNFCSENKEICIALNLNPDGESLSAPSDRWIQTPHPLAGHVTDMAFDKRGYLYAGTGSNGIYVSKDLETWEEVNTGDMHVSSLAPADRGVVYFGAGSLYRMDIDFNAFYSTKTTDLFGAQIGSGNWAGAMAVTSKGVFGSSRNGFYKIVNNKPEKISALDGYYCNGYFIQQRLCFCRLSQVKGVRRPC